MESQRANALLSRVLKQRPNPEVGPTSRGG